MTLHWKLAVSQAKYEMAWVIFWRQIVINWPLNSCQIRWQWLDECGLKEMGLLSILQVTVAERAVFEFPLSKIEVCNCKEWKGKAERIKKKIENRQTSTEIDRPPRLQLQGKRNNASLKLKGAVEWCMDRERIEDSNASVGKWMKIKIRNVDVKSEMFEIQTMLAYINVPDGLG